MKVTTGAGFRLRVDRDVQIPELLRTKSKSTKKLSSLIVNDLIQSDMREMMNKTTIHFTQVIQFLDSMILVQMSMRLFPVWDHLQCLR